MWRSGIIRFRAALLDSSSTMAEVLLADAKGSAWKNLISKEQLLKHVCQTALLSNIILSTFCWFRSNKLRPFWLSITEKQTLPVLDFLWAALQSAEYDRALSRALAMAECPVVPFFGAFLRELKEILAPSTTTTTTHDHADVGGGGVGPSFSKPIKADARRDQQQRQVVGKSF